LLYDFPASFRRSDSGRWRGATVHDPVNLLVFLVVGLAILIAGHSLLPR
jgi:hypothetical protein